MEFHIVEHMNREGDNLLENAKLIFHERFPNAVS